MKKLFTTLSIALIGLISFGQTSILEVVSPAGGYYEASDISFSWTLGEPVIETWENEELGIIVTSGFQQGDFIIHTTSFTVTLLANPDDIGALLTGEGDYEEGEEVSITASEVEGYFFTGWTGEADDVALLDDATSMATSFDMPSRDVTLTANYAEEGQYEVIVNINPDGAGTVTGAGWYTEDDEVTLEATASEGFVFLNWTDVEGDVLGADVTYIFDMPGSEVIINANFIPLYTLSLLIHPEDIGAEVTGAGDYLENELVNISASEVDEYFFAGWTGNPEDVSLLDDPTALEASFEMPGRDVVLTAVYAQEGQNPVVVIVNPEGAGTVTGAGWYFENDEVTLEATANEGFLFVNWTDEEDEVLGSDPTYVFTMPDNEVLVYANFESEEEPSYLVTFVVVDQDEAPVQDATINIVDIEGTLTTNEEGIATISLTDGSYTFTARAADFQDHTDDFIVDGEDITVNVQMQVVSVEPYLLSRLRVYPNPFTNSITLDNAKGVKTVIVTNLIGQKVMELQFSSASEKVIIPTSDLGRGVYLMVFMSETGERVIKKMIKE